MTLGQRNITSGLRMDRKAASPEIAARRGRPGSGRAGNGSDNRYRRLRRQDRVDIFDIPDLLTADEKIGDEVFAVIREAMKAQDVVGVSRVVPGRRERALILKHAVKASLSGRFASVTKSGRK